MRRWTILNLAACTLLAALPGAAQADPRGGGYVATLVTPIAAPRQAILDGVLWKCAGGQCAAVAGGGRAVIACQRLARSFGPVARFAAPAGALPSEDIARCNAPG